MTSVTEGRKNQPCPHLFKMGYLTVIFKTAIWNQTDDNSTLI